MGLPGPSLKLRQQECGTGYINNKTYLRPVFVKGQ